MSICVLSVEEAARLENHGVWPVCKAHLHISKAGATQLISSDTYRYVGGANTAVRRAGPLSMITNVIQSGTWSPQPAAQLNGSRFLGLRVWGLKRRH